MELCDNGHDEVCFEVKACPVCRMKADLKTDLALKDDEIADLEGQVDELKSRIDDLQDKE